MGNDVVWVALISASGALTAAIVAQLLAARAANRSADRTDQREALQWQRTEARRQEDLQTQEAQAALAWQRSEAKRIRDQHEARLRELWAHVLLAQNRIRDALDARSAPAHLKAQVPAASDSAASAAAHAYSVALIGLPEVRQLAKDFYQTTARAEMNIWHERDLDGSAVATWRDALDALEVAVMKESASLLA